MKRGNGADTIATVCAIALIVVGCNQRLSWRLGNSGPYVALADLVVALGFALWLLAGLVRRDLRGAALPPAALWAVVAIAGLSVLQALDLTRPVSELLRDHKATIIVAAKEIMQTALYFIAGYTLLANGLRRPGAARLALYVFAAVSAVTVLGGLISYVQRVSLSLDDIARLQRWLVFRGQIEGARAAVDPFSVGSVLTNRYVYGGFLAIALPLLFGIGLWDKRRWVHVALSLVIAVGAVTCLSGWHLLLVLIGCIVVASRYSPRVLVATAVGGLMVVCAIPLVLRSNARALAEDVVEYRDPAGEDGHRDVKQRWIKWAASLDMMAYQGDPNFLLGVGVGSYQEQVGSYYGLAPHDEITRQPDTENRYLVTASSTGFLGLCSLVATLAYFLMCVCRGRGDSASAVHPGLVAGLCGSLVALVGANLIGDTFVRGLYVPTFLVFALAVVIARDGGHSALESGNPSEPEPPS